MTSNAFEWSWRQFDELDDGAGGLFGTWRRRCKFMVRSLWLADFHRTNHAVLHLYAPRLAARDPWSTSRVIRPYLRRGLSVRGRMRAVAEHYAWMWAQVRRSVCEALYEGDAIELWGGLEAARLVLRAAGPQGREGELAIDLLWRGERVLSCAFSVVEASIAAGAAVPHDGPACVVGAIQGGRNALTALRELGHAGHRLQPTALMVAAVQGLAGGWGIGTVLVVARAAHVYSSYRSNRRRVGLDYDLLWQLAHARPHSAHYWRLPVTPELRSEAEVASRRRAQHRRRCALRLAVFDAVRDATAALIKVPAPVRARG
ncbi:DUF535 family protein [Rhizobacter sp. AJA081-3]|uniref:DUF535 family protein n=1 Tax=Rhizobacter sp. AJA081-3 TaxID=2753607 RepID=UPI001AE0763D|nr:DUF535 family protein [Rhizobacter sp. AJA081-3]QTN25709.1 DUF535 family protein [Rhizobacter sp. AJA081-3]